MPEGHRAFSGQVQWPCYVIFMKKAKILWFWLIAFKTILLQIIKGNEWNMIYVDFHLGDFEDGRPIRKQLIAKRTCSGYEIYWQDLSALRDST